MVPYVYVSGTNNKLLPINETMQGMHFMGKVKERKEQKKRI
jgi:hypothetical protein